MTCSVEGQLTLVKDVQSLKARSPIEVTPSGMTTSVIAWLRSKAPSAMPVTGRSPRVEGISTLPPAPV